MIHVSVLKLATKLAVPDVLSEGLVRQDDGEHVKLLVLVRVD